MTSALFALSLLVHLTNAADVPAAVLRDAQAEVVSMFREIGVDVEWSEARSTRGFEAVRLTVLPRETGALRLDRRMMIGAAMRTPEGIGKAWVFYQRVTEEATHHGVPVARLLACAIAHELGHLLQGTASHADTGVMRAMWNRLDLRRAAQRRLRFTPADAEQFVSYLRTITAP